MVPPSGDHGKSVVNKERVEDIVIWREIFPTRLCHRHKEDRPGYREPTGRWFLLVVIMVRFEPVHEISNNLVCATSKASDQPAQTRSLIRAFACRLNIL